MLSAALASCGGGGGNTITDPDGGGGGGPQVGTVQVLAASPQLQSDQSGATTVAITAQVKDAQNVLLADVPVTFSASSGSVVATQGTTDSAGMATALLSNSTDPTNRQITVTATAGGLSGSVVVNVVGTTITVAGPASLVLGAAGQYTVVVKDSKGMGVPGATATVASAAGNTLSAASLTTDGTGNVSFSLTGSNPGNDTLTVSALGQTATQTVSVSGDSFAFTVPTAGTEILLGNVQVLTVRWTKNGVAQAGKTINFSSTRGSLSAGTAVTDASGDATVTISANTSGPAVVTATNPDSTSTTVNIEFVATSVNSIVLQASPLTVGAGEQSELIAIVRDANNNLVKNKTVEFRIDTDITGGSVSPGTAITDSQGRAGAVYTGGSTSSPANGVVVKAVVQGTAIEATVNLTVARQELFLTLGTGNTLFEPTTATYAKEWVIFVSDVDGSPITGKPVQATIRSRRYGEGTLVWGGSAWTYAPGAIVPSTPAACVDEDANKNGQLDPLEDFNGNTKLEAGNVALVAAVPDSASAQNPCASAVAQGTAANLVTNGQGMARMCVLYPQNYAWWVEATLTAKAAVTGGTEFSESSVFTLDVLADDISDENVVPPNVESPFGTDNNCATGIMPE